MDAVPGRSMSERQSSRKGCMNLHGASQIIDFDAAPYANGCRPLTVAIVVEAIRIARVIYWTARPWEPRSSISDEVVRHANPLYSKSSRRHLRPKPRQNGTSASEACNNRAHLRVPGSSLPRSSNLRPQCHPVGAQSRNLDLPPRSWLGSRGEGCRRAASNV